MKSGFFASKAFWVAAVLGVLILAGAGWAFTQSLNPETRVRDAGCARAVGGGFQRIDPTSDTGAQASSFEVERTITFVLNASEGNATAEACTAYGDIEVRPSTDGLVRVVFTIYGNPSTAEAVRASGVAVAARSGALGFDLQAWQATHASTKTLFSENGVGVHVALELPAQRAWALDLDTRYGDVDVIRIPLTTSRVDTSYGDVQIADASLRGDLTVDTRYGDVDVSVLEALAGAHRLSMDSSYGDVQVRLPGGSQHGYDVTAETRYGEVGVTIGETETYESNKDRDTVRARSKGWADKAVQTTVLATTSYGDVEVRT